MKRALLATAAVLIAGAVTGLSAPLGLAADTGATPQRVDDFQLTDHTRLAQHLYYFGYEPAIVVMSRVNGSAYSKAASVALEQITPPTRTRASSSGHWIPASPTAATPWPPKPRPRT